MDFIKGNNKTGVVYETVLISCRCVSKYLRMKHHFKGVKGLKEV